MGKIKDYTAAKLPSAASKADSLREQYAALLENDLSALQADRENALSANAAEKAKIPAAYEALLQGESAAHEQQRRARQEQNAALGLASGAGAQQELAAQNRYLAALSALRQSRAEAEAEKDAQREALQRQYADAISKTRRENNLSLLQALLSDAERVENSRLQTARDQAAENYRAWQARLKNL